MLHDQSVFSQCTVPQKSESCIKPEPVTCGTWTCHMWNPNLSHVEPEPVTCENRACHMWNPSLSHLEPKPVTCGTMQYSSTVQCTSLFCMFEYTFRLWTRHIPSPSAPSMTGKVHMRKFKSLLGSVLQEEIMDNFTELTFGRAQIKVKCPPTCKNGWVRGNVLDAGMVE